MTTFFDATPENIQLMLDIAAKRSNLSGLESELAEITGRVYKENSQTITMGNDDTNSVPTTMTIKAVNERKRTRYVSLLTMNIELLQGELAVLEAKLNKASAPLIIEEPTPLAADFDPFSLFAV